MSKTPAEKAAEKAAKKEQKDAEKAASAAANDGIVVNDPLDLRPVELPLVIELPEDSSKAQIAYAKVLNAYAYKNPKKWAIKKDKEIAKLKALKNAPDPVESNLQYKNNALSL